MASYLPTPEVNSGNAHLVLTESILTACRAASLAAKEFAAERDLNLGLARNVNSFITTGDEHTMTLVILYLTKLREQKEKQQMESEEKEIDLQREEKARLDAEEDRHLMFLQRNHSREALH